MADTDPASIEATDRVYDAYVKPLERDHPNEFVLVTPDGQTIFGQTLLEVVEQAHKRPSRDNFIFKVGERAVGKIR